MSDPDRMVLIGTPEKDVDGALMDVRRDYHHAIVLGHRLDEGLVGWLRERLDEWEVQKDAYLARECRCGISPGAVAEVIPLACPIHGIPCEHCGGVEECKEDCDG